MHDYEKQTKYQLEKTAYGVRLYARESP